MLNYKITDITFGFPGVLQPLAVFPDRACARFAPFSSQNFWAFGKVFSKGGLTYDQINISISDLYWTS